MNSLRQHRLILERKRPKTMSRPWRLGCRRLRTYARVCHSRRSGAQYVGLRPGRTPSRACDSQDAPSAGNGTNAVNAHRQADVGGGQGRRVAGPPPRDHRAAQSNPKPRQDRATALWSLRWSACCPRGYGYTAWSPRAQPCAGTTAWSPRNGPTHTDTGIRRATSRDGTVPGAVLAVGEASNGDTGTCTRVRLQHADGAGGVGQRPSLVVLHVEPEPRNVGLPAAPRSP